jgi:transcription initiation factor TFIID subunit 13
MRRKVLYPKEIKQLMYGSGDVAQPLDESVEVLDDCLEWFIEDLCNEALKHSQGRLKTVDFLTALQQDSKKVETFNNSLRELMNCCIWIKS